MLEGELTLQRGDFCLDTGAFAFPTEGVSVLFGRSGCGKSTLLRAITGLDAHTRGTLLFKGERWQNGAWRRSTAGRDIGFVFQDAALFPHLTVRGNLQFALQRAPNPSATALTDVATQVGITPLLDHPVATLSGGERQRVAIGRALLGQPRLLCMDEPLSALDWRAKAELLNLIDAVAKDSGVPVLYITHSPLEVERLANRVLFMAAGRIERIETLQQALSRPDSELFDEEGPATVLYGQLSPPDVDGLMRFGNAVLTLRLVAKPGQTQPAVFANHGNSRLRILARDVSLATHEPQGLSILNQLPIAITALYPDAQGRVCVACQLADGNSLLAEITQYSCRKLGLAPGMAAYALVKSVALME